MEYIEEQGCVAGAIPEDVSDLAKNRQRNEMGTLGSGNHYLEVQVVDRIYEPLRRRHSVYIKGRSLFQYTVVRADSDIKSAPII